jgi:hypothetical protein
VTALANSQLNTHDRLSGTHRVLGPDDPLTLVTRHNLAHWRGKGGDPAGAAAYERLLKDFLRIVGPNHRYTLVTRRNLAHWSAKSAGPRPR